MKIHKKLIKILMPTLIIATMLLMVISSPDHPDPPEIGYEIIDEGSVIHIWNEYDDYYFNATSGIQLTNHYDEYWTHNIFCGGYDKNGWIWYCNDELDFVWSIETDNLTYTNYSGYKDISVTGRNFRIKLQYVLNWDEEYINVIPSIENTNNKAFNYDMGFRWRIQDIRINMNYTDNKYILDETIYNGGDPIDYVSSNMAISEFFAYWYYPDNVTSEFLQLTWEDESDYTLTVRDESGQYNAPAELEINIGLIAPNEKKSILLTWIDAVTIDGSVEDVSDEHNMAPMGVFINTTHGYVVYASATGDGDLIFESTTDGGANWNGGGTLSTRGKYFGGSVWYDRWTPGNEGDLIHVVAAEPGLDDTYYFWINSTDGSSGGDNRVIFSGSAIGATIGGYGIVRSTTGKLYAGGQAGKQEVYISDDEGATWETDILLGADSGWLYPENDDYFQMMPLSNGDILFIYADDSQDRLLWFVYNETLGDLQNNETVLISGTVPTATNVPGGAAIYRPDNTIYLAWNNNYQSDGKISIFKFNDSTRSWSNLGNITTAVGHYQASIIVDEGTRDLYLAYSRFNTRAGQTDVYYKKSINEGSSWGSETKLSSVTDDNRHVRGTMTGSSRHYVFWMDDDLNDLYGATIELITKTVEWDVATLDLGDGTRADGNLTGTANIVANWSNTNVAVICDSGYCGTLDTNWVTQDISPGNNEVTFDCSNETSGTFTAIFNVTSTEYTIPDQINVSCVIFDWGELSVSLTEPTSSITVESDATFNLNATVKCIGGAGSKCGILYAYARYNESAVPDAFINVSIDIPFFIASKEEGTHLSNWSTNDPAGSNLLGIATNGINIWTTHTDTDDVFKWDMNGNHISNWSATEYGSNDIGGITTDGTNIWTTDYVLMDVFKWDMNGNHILNWSANEDGNTNLFGITTDGTNIWTVDVTLDDVFKWDMNGNPISDFSVGEYGNEGVIGITTDGTNIWTTDQTIFDVFKWDMTGNYLSNFSVNEYGSTGLQMITNDGVSFWTTDWQSDDVFKWTLIAPNPLTSPATLELGDTFNVSWSVNATATNYGLLSCDIDYPLNNTNQTQNATFDLNATVECIVNPSEMFALDVFFNSSYASVASNNTEDTIITIENKTVAECGTVYAYARYNESDVPDTDINTTEDNPFYTIGGGGGDPSYWNIVDDEGDGTAETYLLFLGDINDNNYYNETSLVFTPTKDMDITSLDFNVHSAHGVDYITSMEVYLCTGVVASCVAQDKVCTLFNGTFNPSWSAGWQTVYGTSYSVNADQDYSVDFRTPNTDNDGVSDGFYIKADGAAIVDRFFVNKDTAGCTDIAFYADIILNETSIPISASNPETSPSVLNQGDTFNVTWTVNATGTNNTQYWLDVLFNSSYGSNKIADNSTPFRKLCIGTCPTVGVPADDLSFTVSYPSKKCTEGNGSTDASEECERCAFIATNFSVSGIANEINVSCEGQNETVSFIKLTNTGSVALDFTMELNDTVDTSNFRVKVSQNESGWEATCTGTEPPVSDCVYMEDSTQRTVSQNLQTATFEELWYFADFLEAIPVDIKDYGVTTTSTKT